MLIWLFSWANLELNAWALKELLFVLRIQILLVVLRCKSLGEGWLILFLLLTYLFWLYGGVDAWLWLVIIDAVLLCVSVVLARLTNELRNSKHHHLWSWFVYNLILETQLSKSRVCRLRQYLILNCHKTRATHFLFISQDWLQSIWWYFKLNPS